VPGQVLISGLADPNLLSKYDATILNARTAKQTRCLQLRPDDVATRTTWHGMAFAFCCAMCMQAVTDNPGRFRPT
jgi:hypothetical protein